MCKHCIELLAPAKNVEVGMAAINSGADAVYIGAPQFGARAAAGNSIEDIARLASYAHKFNCRVLATLNTLLTNEELPAANILAWQLYEAGADALIIQDMGLLETDLPPIRLHASTQCNNRTAEHVRWLKDVGFSRAVLARELSIEQIREIRSATSIELEVFIHGALCVSYSGQCYMSECLRKRSANRGECAQMCRLPYDVLDADGKELIHGKHVLSLFDLDRSAYLKELIDAGVTTFKIEGRLKDENYVKNIVSYYHNILQSLDNVSRTSFGQTDIWTLANPEKTFHRSATDYFLHQRSRPMANLDTPKSTGEKVGTVIGIGQNSVTISSPATLNAGDGICIGSEGFQVYASDVKDDKTVVLWDKAHSDIDRRKLHIGQVVFRNFDKSFNEQLTHLRQQRKLPISIELNEDDNGFCLIMETANGIKAQESFTYPKQPATNIEKARQTIITQLGKLGDTIFVLSEPVKVDTDNWFIPISVLNEWRRKVASKLDELCSKHYLRQPQQAINHACYYSEQPLDYQANIHNDKAAEFYLQCGAVIGKDTTTVTELMRCRYCLKYEMGWCKNKQRATDTPKEPLYLRLGKDIMPLQFDCKRCEMVIKKDMRYEN